MALGNVVKSFSKMNISPRTVASAAIIAGPEFKSGLNDGLSAGGAATRAAANLVFEHTAPVLYWGAQAAMAAPGIYSSAYQFRRQKGNEIQRHKHDAWSGIVGNTYTDTAQAATMRQAAVQQIQGNKLNARSALGGEARLFAPNFQRRTNF